MATQRSINGLHDPGGQHLFGDLGGWVVNTRAIGHDANDLNGYDFRRGMPPNVEIIARLNNGYEPYGTIPARAFYADFARRVANVVRASNANYYIIGNEPNFARERPHGIAIEARDYIDCFIACVRAVTGGPLRRCGLIPAAVAPWNVDTGDWLQYWQTIVNGLGAFAGGWAVHTYTHGTNPALVTSTARMDPPYQDRWYNFFAYRDFLSMIPSDYAGLPVFITETDQDAAWADVDSGWVRAAYDEIDLWNRTVSEPQIDALCLYRWQDGHDQWGIENKFALQNDIKRAFARQYTPKDASIAVSQDNHVYLPIINAGGAAQPPNGGEALPPIKWDGRLTDRGVIVRPADVEPGQRFFRVVEGQWLDVPESQGRHHIYMDVRGADGQRLINQLIRVSWPNGETMVATEPKPDELYSANYPMSPSRNDYAVELLGEYPAETVTGIGMGREADPGNPASFNAGEHTSTAIVWELTTMPSIADSTPPVSDSDPGNPANDMTQPDGVRIPLLVHPVASPEYRRITQRFGANPADYEQFIVGGVPLLGHNGIDFATPVGVSVRAVDDGVVSKIADDAGGYGLHMVVDHDWGQSLYAHLSEPAQFGEFGQHVERGDIIAKSGNSGNSTGPHLHFAIRPRGANIADGWGGYVDPLPYLVGTNGGGVNGELVAAAVGDYAVKYGVRPSLLLSMLWSESSFRDSVTSAAGAMGIGQIMPMTWDEWSRRVVVADPFNYAENTRVAAAYLAWCINQMGGDERAGVYAYNVGVGNARAQPVPTGDAALHVARVIHGADLLDALDYWDRFD